MFADLENEIVRILAANLSPALVPSNRIVAGTVAPPTPANLPLVAFAVRTFEVVPADDQATPPRVVKHPVTDTFPASAGTSLTLSQPPIEPLRSVVVTPPIGNPQILRERDDYTADFVNGIVHLRLPPEGSIGIDYFTRQNLHVFGATRLRASGRLTVWADPATASANLTQVSLTATGALLSNIPILDGFLSRTEDILDSGLAALGVRQTFLVFEAAQLTDGQAASGNQWNIELTFPAWIVLVPRNEQTGIIHSIATSVSWDTKSAQSVLAATPPLLLRPVTDVSGVDAALAAGFRARGITSIGSLATAPQSGPAAADAAIGRAQNMRGLAARIVRNLVFAQPKIDNSSSFFAQALASVNLAGLDIAPAVATSITTDCASLAADSSAALTFADLFEA